MTPLEMCVQTLKDTERLVSQVSTDQIDTSTPCPDWDVRTLVNHMVGVLDALQWPTRGGQPSFDLQPVRDVIGNDAHGAFSRKPAEFMTAWSVPGATERVVQTAFGEQPAEVFLGLATAEMLLHGWDLATSSASYSMNEDAAEQVLAAMQRMLNPEMRGDGKAFADEVPTLPNTSVQDRLLAFSGRAAG